MVQLLSPKRPDAAVSQQESVLRSAPHRHGLKQPHPAHHRPGAGANWTEGRKVSELPECWDEKNDRLKYPGQVFREWLEASAGGGATAQAIDSPTIRTTQKLLKAARVKAIAPPEYRDLPWSLYAELPADADADEVGDIFARAKAQPVDITQRGLRLVQGRASGMKPPYWQQVIENLMLGEHDLPHPRHTASRDGRYLATADLGEDSWDVGVGDTPQEAVMAALASLGEPYASEMAQAAGVDPDA